MKSSSASPAAVALATWFGCGYSPVGPGTAGSLGALAFAWAANHFWGWDRWHFLAAGVLLIAPGIWAAGEVARAAQTEDPGLVVVDEVSGQWITLAGALSLSATAWLLAFVLFRILDIWKPFPARKLEDLPGGIGVMADDVMAGIYGALIMYLAGQWNLY